MILKIGSGLSFYINNIFTLGYVFSSNVGLSGIFDTSVNSASTNTKESSVMNFLSTVESRTAQAASSGTTLLPQFRAPSWQTGDLFFLFQNG